MSVVEITRVNTYVKSLLGHLFNYPQGQHVPDAADVALEWSKHMTKSATAVTDATTTAVAGAEVKALTYYDSVPSRTNGEQESGLVPGTELGAIKQHKLP